MKSSHLKLVGLLFVLILAAGQDLNAKQNFPFGSPPIPPIRDSEATPPQPPISPGNLMGPDVKPSKFSNSKNPVELAKALSSGSPLDQLQGITAVNEIGDEGISALPDLIESLNSDDEAVRTSAMGAIKGFGIEAEDASKQLAQIMTDSRSDYEKAIAADALVHVSPSNDKKRNANQILVNCLRSNSIASSEAAANALVETGDSGCGKVAEMLSHPEAEFRAMCAGALGSGNSLEARSALFPLLKDSEEVVRRSASMSLSKLGPVSANEADVIAKTIELEKSRAVKIYLIRTLRLAAETNTIVDTLRSTAESGEPGIAAESIRTLRQVVQDQQTLTELYTELAASEDGNVSGEALAALGDDNANARKAGMQMVKHSDTALQGTLLLAGQAKTDQEAANQLIYQLQEANDIIAVESLFGLASKNTIPESSIDSLLPRLAQPNLKVQYAATYTAGMNEVDTPKTRQQLLENAKSQDDMLRMLSKWALAKTNPSNEDYQKEAVKEIKKSLRSSDSGLKEAAMQSLADLPLTPDVVPALIPELARIAQEDQEGFKSIVVTVLARIIAQLDRPQLLQPFLNHPVFSELAHDVIEQLGGQAVALEDQLVQALETSNASVQQRALFSLASIGPKNSSTATKISSFLDSDNEETRAAAAYALGRMGTKAASAVPKLISKINGRSRYFDSVAAVSLAYVAPNNQQAVKTCAPILMSDLRSNRQSTVLDATRAIGHFGPAAKGAVSKLQQLKVSSKWDLVRVAADRSIKSISADQNSTTGN